MLSFLSRLRLPLIITLPGALLLGRTSPAGEPVPVRYEEGAVHGFLALRSAEGKILATGDLIQTVHGDRGSSRLIFRFKDGSIDDETAVFTQRGHFRLVRDHHIQKGPIFPKAVDVLINAISGEVTVRYKDKDQQKAETDHLDLPPDLANGIILDVLKNISPDSGETKLSYVVSTPKPRLVTLSIKTAGNESFSVAEARRQSIRFDIKPEFGGIAGLIAPLIGKKPPVIGVWISAGPVPAFVKMEGPLYLGGPVWTMEMTSPVWRRTAQANQ